MSWSRGVPLEVHAFAGAVRPLPMAVTMLTRLSEIALRSTAVRRRRQSSRRLAITASRDDKAKSDVSMALEPSCGASPSNNLGALSRQKRARSSVKGAPNRLPKGMGVAREVVFNSARCVDLTRHDRGNCGIVAAAAQSTLKLD